MGLLNLIDKTAIWFGKNTTKGVSKGIRLGQRLGNNIINEVRDPAIKRMKFTNDLGKRIGGGIKAGAGWIGNKLRTKRLGRVGQKVRRSQAKVNNSLSRHVKWGRRTAVMGGLAVGTTAMVGIGVMKGMMNQAREYTYDRYTQDYTYSKNMLSNSRLTRTMGSRMIDHNSTMGLSNSLSKIRHGY